MARLAVDVAVALRSFSLEVGLDVGRETVALVGPSGAGKTTVLRCVAGLLHPDRGRVALDGEPWFADPGGVREPPERRSVGFVFQDYALFPHLTIRANVAFAGRQRADALLERFGIAHLAGARPGRVSGGERQRVALARALARDPAVLLLDEPLSALDTDTRLRVRAELHDLLGELRLPTLLVTHDFRDALALADRIGVVVDGRLRQIGTGDELMARPADAFVVTFTGGNLLHGTATPEPGGGSRVLLDDGTQIRSAQAGRGRVGVGVYPWEVQVVRDGAPDRNAVAGTVRDVWSEGGRTRVTAGAVTGERPPEDHGELRRGERVLATFSPQDTRLVAQAERE